MGGDAAARGPPARAEPLMPLSALERRARMGVRRERSRRTPARGCGAGRRADYFLTRLSFRLASTAVTVTARSSVDRALIIGGAPNLIML